MGNKIITEEDFWVCSGGNVPAPFQTTQLSTKKASGHKYITVEDKSTLSWIDFGCKKLMLIMAIIAAVVVVAVVATGGAALAVVVAAGAAAGAAGAAYGAVLGALICGQKAAVARKWLNSKKDLIIQGQKAITGDHVMTCAVFGETITFAPQIKNWWQAIALGTANYFTGIMEGMLAGAAIGLGGGLLAGGSSALAAGGIRGLGQAALTALRSMPKNLLANFVSSFGKAGLAMRGVEGVTNVLSQYGNTGSASVGDFLSGVVSEETDAYNSARNILTGNGTWQDVAGLAMLFAPDGGSPNRDTPTTDTNKPDQPSPAPDGEKPPTEDDASTVVAKPNDGSTPAPVGEFDAFEATPIKPDTTTTIPDTTITPDTPTPTKPDAQTIRENVLRNIEESRRARESSNFNSSPNTVQQRIVDNVTNGNTTLDNNAQKGNFGEMATDLDMINHGYEPLHDRVTDLDAPTVQGIDGVYRNANPPPEFVVVDAKYGSAQLGSLADGTRQMSDDWIDSRLNDAVGEDMADEIRASGYERVVAKVDENGNVTYRRVDADGYVIRGNRGIFTP